MDGGSREHENVKLAHQARKAAVRPTPRLRVLVGKLKKFGRNIGLPGATIPAFVLTTIGAVIAGLFLFFATSSGESNKPQLAEVEHAQTLKDESSLLDRDQRPARDAKTDRSVQQAGLKPKRNTRKFRKARRSTTRRSGNTGPFQVPVKDEWPGTASPVASEPPPARTNLVPDWCRKHDLAAVECLEFRSRR